MTVTTFTELTTAGSLRFSDGYRTKSSELATSGFRILRAADVNGHADASGADYVSPDRRTAIGQKLARLGDIVLTTKGTVGRVAEVAQLNEEVVYSPQLCYFRVPVDGPLMSKFLRYWFSSAEFTAQASHLSSNTDMAPYLSLRDIGLLKITLPTLEMQRSISAVLSALDDKIAANAAVADTANALLEAMFFGSRHDYVEVPFMEVCDVDFGEPFKGSLFSEAGTGRPLIRIRDLRTAVCGTWTRESRVRETVVEPGDLLVGMDAEFRPSLWLGEPGVLNQRVAKIASSKFGSVLLREAVRGPLLEIERSKSGTTVIHLNKSDLLQSRIVFPGESQAKRLDGQMQPIGDLIVQLAMENRILAELRDTLLPPLMSGRIKVRDAERRVEDAV